MKKRIKLDNGRPYKIIYDRKSGKDKRVYLKESICSVCGEEFNHRSRLQKKCKKCKINK